MPSNPGSDETIFAAASQWETPEQRAAYLEEACAGNPELRRRVEELLRAADEAKTFLEQPLGGPRQPAARTPPDGASQSPQLGDAFPAEGAGSRIGRYKLLQQIGEGGCGTVFMAEQEEPVRRRVALKVIKLGMDTKSVVARFEAERQALAMMDHPNIARVLDAGATDSGRPFFVMELVRGIPITRYCDENKLGTKERLDLFIKVCQAIQHAHQKGIIHRDIKPSNILVTLHDGVPVPKVIDFGIAKATEGRLTNATLFTAFEQFIGTPAYMSPEQAEMSGLDIDTRSDIYALGVLLYELLTGKTPFDAKELAQSGIDAMRKTIREKEPQRPSTRLSTMLGDALTATANAHGSDAVKLLKLIRGDLDWIVMKCLEKDRTRRYETANGLAADLKRHLDNEPVVARPPSTAYRFQKAFRRNKLAFAAAGAVSGALLLGVVVSLWQGFRATQASKSEHRQRLVAEGAQAVAQAKQSEAETERRRADVEAKKAIESQAQSRRLLYASDMNLAQQSLKLNNLGKARRLLDRHRPQPGEEDLRGWEWRYLWQLTRSSALVTLTNQPARGFDVSFSPDGTRLAVGWLDGRVDLWDVPGRRLVRALTEGAQPYSGHVAFSPNLKLLAATSEIRGVTLYDLDSGRDSILWKTPDQGSWNIRDLSFSPDGSRLVIYASSVSDASAAVWVVNMASTQVESRHPAGHDFNVHFGAARLSSDNRLYFSKNDYSRYRYRIECLDLTTGQKLWETVSPRDLGLTAMALSPDGRVLVSGSGFEDPTIRIWDTATGRPLGRLDGHTSWVVNLTFTKDGRRLISAATDQSIRIWNTDTWTESKVLRGHSDEVHAVAISETAKLLASAGKDGNLMLWQDDAKSTPDGYRRLPENLGADQVQPLDQSRVLLLPTGRPLQMTDLKGNSAPVTLPVITSSANLFGKFGTNLLCLWNGTNQILVSELQGFELVQRGAITLDSAKRPIGAAYNPARRLLAWSEGGNSASVYVASLATPRRRIELRSDVPGGIPVRFSDDGSYLAAINAGLDSLRVWNVETGQVVASIGGAIRAGTFAAGGRVLGVVVNAGIDHEVRFYNLVQPDQPPRVIPGRNYSENMTVSADGGLVASSTAGGRVQLFDPAKGELIETIHGHLNAAMGLAFSPDGQRLISASGGREPAKLWDVGTRQELLTLTGTGSYLSKAHWSADGNVILAGVPWQAWRAPTWAEINAAEAKEKAEGKQP